MLRVALLILVLAVAVLGDARRRLVEDDGPPFDKLRFKLPVFPEQFEGTLYDSASDLKIIKEDHNGRPLNKYVPRELWFAIRNRNDSHPDHHKGIRERNPLWRMNYFDNDAKDEYMVKVWGNTSVYAVYDILNPGISCSRPEIWRLATLYHHGGIYMDDDSTIGKPFDDIVQQDDKYVAGQERYAFDGDKCYIDSFRLSKKSLDSRFPQTNPVIRPFQNRFFMNWAIVAAPRHPLVKRVLETIVKIIEAEFKGKPFIKLVGQDRGKRLMCSTTFPLSYISREMLLEALEKDGGEIEGDSKDMSKRVKAGLQTVGIRSTQYEDSYAADMKAWYNDYLPDHWTRQMNKFKAPYLRQYGEPDLVDFEGCLVQGPGQMEIFLVRNGSRHGFPNFQTFAELGYDVDMVQDVPHKILWQIPFDKQLASKTDKSFLQKNNRCTSQQ